MDAIGHNWRGLLQEAQQKKGFRPPVYETSKSGVDGSGWRVVIYFDGSVASDGFAQKFEFIAPPTVVRKKEAEKMASKALWQQLSSLTSTASSMSTNCAQDRCLPVGAFRPVSTGDLSRPTKHRDDSILVCDLVYCDFDTAPWIADMFAQFPNIYYVLYSRHYKRPCSSSSDNGTNVEWRTNSSVRDCVVGQMIVDIVKQQMSDSLLAPPVVVCNDEIVHTVLTKMNKVTLLSDEKSTLEYFKRLVELAE